MPQKLQGEPDSSLPSAVQDVAGRRLWTELANLFAPALDEVSFRNRTAQLLRKATLCEVVTFATILNLQTSTVKSYIHTLFNKLGVDNRHAAVLRTLELARPMSQPAPGSGRLRTPTQLPR